MVIFERAIGEKLDSPSSHFCSDGWTGGMTGAPPASGDVDNMGLEETERMVQLIVPSLDPVLSDFQRAYFPTIAEPMSVLRELRALVDVSRQPRDTIDPSHSRNCHFQPSSLSFGGFAS